MPDLFVRSDLKVLKVINDFKDLILILLLLSILHIFALAKIIYNGKKTSVLSPYRGA